jgi:hypothetical protein
MRLSLASVLVVLCLAPGAALAGPFGGFSSDGSRYLVDRDRVCQPVTGARGAPRCEKKGADEVARLGFRKGAVQRGASARVAAQVSGTRLVVRSADGKTVRADWDSGNPVGAVSAVYLSENGKLVAVEYDARLSGRSSAQVIVLTLAGTPPTGTPPTGTPPTGTPPSGAGTPSTGTPAKPGGQNPGPTDPPALAGQLRAADRELDRKKWKKAEEEYRRALATAPGHPVAQYGLAAALAGQKRTADAIAALVELAGSTHPHAPRWLVEARLGSHFTKLQSEAGFRRAVGIDRDPQRPPTPYERLVGLGGHWEQTGTACQQPTVDLRLDRKSEKFQLSIRNRCQGEDETTRLAGSWEADGSGVLRLRFPNVDGPEEALECQLGASPDRSGEDVLSCTLDELVMAMRVVRR